MVLINEMPCHPDNCGKKREQNIEWIVMHYTGNLNDKARDNGTYFGRPNEFHTSCHFFVDDNEVVLSVGEDTVAHHCGAKTYTHDFCRNENSLGVEMCGTTNDGITIISNRTMHRSAELVSMLHRKYNIPIDHIIRHYDVTGKRCPAMWIDNNEIENFRKIVCNYDFIDMISKKVQKVVKKRIENKEGFILPSVCIGQAIIESDFGSSELAKNANAIFGIKIKKNWTGKTYSVKSIEYRDGGEHYYLGSDFKAYDSLDDSIADYFDHICELSIYDKAVGETDAWVSINAIASAGYATAPHYAKVVFDYIMEYDLTRYDEIIRV